MLASKLRNFYFILRTYNNRKYYFNKRGDIMKLYNFYCKGF